MDTVQRGSNTVHRAMAVLMALRDAPAEGIGISELTRMVGANRSTVYRIMDALKAYEFVRPGDNPGMFRLGFGVVALGDSLLRSLDVRDVAAPILRELSDRTRETCHLAILDDLEITYIDKVESEQAMRLTSRPGTRRPLYCTSLGKSLLAAMPADELAATLDQLVLTPRTPQTITTREGLMEDLRLVEGRGWATDIGESLEGVNCVGAAVYGRGPRPVAAISASAPAHRFTTDNINDFGQIVLDAANQISQELGRHDAATTATR